MPEQVIQFELQPGQALPDVVTPPDFYAPLGRTHDQEQ
jgi:hypothetical protein